MSLHGEEAVLGAVRKYGFIIEDADLRDDGFVIPFSDGNLEIHFGWTPAEDLSEEELAR